MSLLPKKHTKISVVQMNIVMDDIDLNLKTASHFIEDSALNGSKLIILPQTFATGINPCNLRGIAQAITGGQIASFLSQKSYQHRIYLIAGILEKDGSDIFDTAVIFSPDGVLIGKYRRFLLWTMEKDFISQGDLSRCIKTEIGKIGLLVGYDIDFPETCRGYFMEEVDIIVCISNLFRKFSYSIDSICMTRAAENHCYFVFSNGIGYNPFVNSYYLGESMVTCDPLFLTYELKQKIKPNIGIINQQGRREGVLSCNLYVEELIKCKKKTPQRSDMRHAAAHIKRIYENDYLAK